MENKKTKDFKDRSYKIKKAHWTVFDGLCKGCGLCKAVCPFGAIDFSKEHLGVYNTPGVKVNPKLCRLCRLCEQICPDCAIKIETKAQSLKD